jgi:hypothetical protein
MILFCYYIHFILDVRMMMTRSRIVAATTADAATLLNPNPIIIDNKQTQSERHHILRTKKDLLSIRLLLRAVAHVHK